MSRISSVNFFSCYIRRYWSLILWISFTLIIFWNTYRKFKTKPQYYYLRSILGEALCISRGTAPILTICSCLVILPVCRSLHTIVHSCLAKISSSLLATWLSRVKIMHMVCATTLIIFSILHTGAHIINNINFSIYYTHQYPEINLAKFKGENPAMLICTWTGYSGIIMLLLLLIMAVTSTSKFRLKYFNTFYVTHHLFIIFLLLLLTHPFSGILKEQYNINQHKPGCILFQNISNTNISEIKENQLEFCKHPPKFKCIPSQSWIWILITLIIYTLELGCRKYKGNEMEAIQACHVIKNVIHLRLKCPENFHVYPGQYILIQCNKISRIEWHPFTVTKCPDKSSKSLELLISIRGDWTKDLHSLIKTPFCFDESTSYISRLYHSPLMFNVDGPFASAMQYLINDKYVICVAAGIGITSYIASLRYLLNYSNDTPKRLYLLWLTRDPKQIMWYGKLLCDLQDKFWEQNQPDRFQIKLFITKKHQKQETQILFKNHKLENRIYFGRPDWKEEFRIFNFIYNSKNVTLLCCGPKTLTKELKKECLKQKSKGCSYKFIQEGF